jgi:hypothetical protein
MALKFRRGTTAQKSGSLAFGEPYVNTSLGTLQIGLDTGDVTLASAAGIISGSSQFTSSYDERYETQGRGIISSSAQIDTLFNIDGLISGSSQIDATATTNFASGVKTELNANTVISGSSQVNLADVTGNTTTNVSEGTYLYYTDNRVKDKLNSENVVSGSSQITITNTTGFSSYSSSVDSRILTEKGRVDAILSAADADKDSFAEIVTLINSVDTTNDNAFAAFYTSSTNTNNTQNDRLAALETKTGSIAIEQSEQNARLASLEAETGSLEARNSTLATYTASVDTKFSTLASYTASLETKNSTLATYTASVDTKFSTLGTYTASLETKNSTLASVTASLLSSQTNLNAYTGSLLGAFQVTGSKVNFLGDIVVWGTQSVINSQNVEIADNILYLAPTASSDNDLGIVGHYNDGTYRHAGVFMDASDGHTWKVFNSLQDETIGTVNTSGTGFTLAPFKAGVITGTSFNGTINATNGIVSGSSQIDVASTTGDIALGSRTSGNYVATITAGTGVSSTGATTGEGIAHTISIGQSVATSASPTFAGLTINGAITATGDITAYYSSDRRYKNTIQTIPNALDKVKKLNGVTWEWNENVNEVTKAAPTTGLIAQEVQEVLPQVVKEKEDGYLGLDYAKMVGLLIEAIKEQQIKIDNLTVEVENLKKQKGL